MAEASFLLAFSTALLARLRALERAASSSARAVA
jgi:hypothetical protein